jgi:hypothetical protein
MYLEIGVPALETSIEALIVCDWEKAAQGRSTISSRTNAKPEPAFLTIETPVSGAAAKGATELPLNAFKAARIQQNIHLPACEQAFTRICAPSSLDFKLGTILYLPNRNARTIQGIACKKQLNKSLYSKKCSSVPYRCSSLAEKNNTKNVFTKLTFSEI